MRWPSENCGRIIVCTDLLKAYKSYQEFCQIGESFFPSCAVITRCYGRRGVVLAGGYEKRKDYEDVIDTVDIYSFDDSRWRKGQMNLKGLREYVPTQ